MLLDCWTCSNVIQSLPLSSQNVQTEGTSGHLQEKYDRDIGYGRPCMGEPPPHQLGGDSARGQGELRPEHPDDTCRGALQQGQRTGDPGLLDHIDEETGREGWFSLTFEWHPVMYPHQCLAIKCWCFRNIFTFPLMMTKAVSQNFDKVWSLSWYQRTLLSVCLWPSGEFRMELEHELRERSTWTQALSDR